jgi:hypothetical protein
MPRRRRESLFDGSIVCSEVGKGVIRPSMARLRASNMPVGGPDVPCRHPGQREGGASAEATGLARFPAVALLRSPGLRVKTEEHSSRCYIDCYHVHLIATSCANLLSPSAALHEMRRCKITARLAGAFQPFACLVLGHGPKNLVRFRSANNAFPQKRANKQLPSYSLPVTN